MELSPVFKYESAKRYLLDYVTYQQKKDSSFSLRKWSKVMGFTSHTLLVMVLQGKRSLTLKQVPFLSKGMNLSSAERLYFQALIQFEAADTEEEKDLCRLWLAESNPGETFCIREVDEYMAIAHWIHSSILAMTNNKNFTDNAEMISKRLGNKVKTLEVRSALERLKSLGLLVEKNGRWVSSYSRITTKDDITNRGAREQHKQVAKLGIDAIEEQSVDEREFQSFAMSICSSKIPLAKEMIRKFRTQLSEAVSSKESEGDAVYQTQIQFFRLTEHPSEIVLTEEASTASVSEN